MGWSLKVGELLLDRRKSANSHRPLREKERTNPKFSFLSPNDSYNAYYLWRLSEIREVEARLWLLGEQAKLQLKQRSLKAPRTTRVPFSARMPNISAQDLEVVRLTALFVAKNGRQFMTTLSQRETGNTSSTF